MMKLEPMAHRKSRKWHKPLVSLKELEAILGVSPQKIGWAMRDANCPKPRIDTRAGCTVKNRWYDKDEFINWWKSLESK